MGLLDYFRSYFPAPRHYDTGRRLGPNELPPDILDDFENSQRNQHPPSHFNNQDGENPNNNGFFFNDDDVGGRNRDGFFPGQSYEFRTFHDIDREFQEAFQEMDSMFKGFFGGGDGGPGFGFHFPPPGQSFELPPPPDNHVDDYDAGTSANNGKEKSLREKMLNKENDDGNSGFATPFHFNDEDGRAEGGFSFRIHTPLFGNIFPLPFNHNSPPEIPPVDDNQPRFDNQPRVDDDKRGDQNLDNSLDSHSIDRILDSQTPQPPPPLNELSPFGNRTPHNGMASTFKFSTITKKINPDGSVETTSRKRDSEGNEEVSVTRNLGDQSHTTISKKNREGEEKVENFINMEESDMEEFESKWKGGGEREKSPRDRLLTPQQRDDMVEWFSSWWKPKL